MARPLRIPRRAGALGLGAVEVCASASQKQCPPACNLRFRIRAKLSLVFPEFTTIPQRHCFCEAVAHGVQDSRIRGTRARRESFRYTSCLVATALSLVARRCRLTGHHNVPQVVLYRIDTLESLTMQRIHGQNRRLRVVLVIAAGFAALVVSLGTVASHWLLQQKRLDWCE